MMTSEPHDVVKLLVARMESNPEEFRVGGKPYCDRWDEHVSDIQAFGNAADKAALDEKLRDIRLGEIHERVLDELLNGPDKRRKAEEDREYERQVMQQTLQRNTTMQQGGGGGASLPVSTSPYQNAAGQGIVGKFLHQTWLDDYVYNGSITAAQPEPKPSPYAKIKKALGI